MNQASKFLLKRIISTADKKTVVSTLLFSLSIVTQRENTYSVMKSFCGNLRFSQGRRSLQETLSSQIN